MNKKLHEAISKNYGAKFEIKGVEFVLMRFTAAIMARYEEENDMGIEKLMDTVQKKPATWGTKIAFDLMTKESKEEVDNDIDVFRSIVEVEDLGVVAGAIADAVNAAMPVSEKTVDGKSSKKKKTGEGVTPG